MDKHSRDFWGCLQHVLLEYGGMASKTSNFNGTLAVGVFVGQAAPDSQGTKARVAGSKTIENSHVAVFVYDG